MALNLFYVYVKPLSDNPFGTSAASGQKNQTDSPSIQSIKCRD
jgi:hypothetical protein